MSPRAESQKRSGCASSAVQFSKDFRRSFSRLSNHGGSSSLLPDAKTNRRSRNCPIAQRERRESQSSLRLRRYIWHRATERRNPPYAHLRHSEWLRSASEIRVPLEK